MTDTTTVVQPRATTVAERRRQALERLHNGSVPERRASGRRAVKPPREDRPRLWDVQHGAAPVAGPVDAVASASSTSACVAPPARTG